MERKLKLQESIGLAVFLGFVISINLFFLTNCGIDASTWETFIHDPGTKFLLYINGIAVLVCIGIKRPGFNHFLSELILCLRDGKLTPEEKLHLIEILKDEFLGKWADLSVEVHGNPDPIEPIP